jgi:citrate lyase beta subunit
MAMTLRSYLFVPATRIERIAKAQASGAGAVIVDLEDAVAAQDKEAARESLKQWLQSAEALPVYVRINSVDTPWYRQDCELCTSHKVMGVVIPKAEEPSLLMQLHQQLCG